MRTFIGAGDGQDFRRFGDIAANEIREDARPSQELFIVGVKDLAEEVGKSVRL